MIRARLHLVAFALCLSTMAHTTRLDAAVSSWSDLEADQQSPNPEAGPSFVEQVRVATAIFRDVNQAIGYTPFGGCVSGPEEGAMGVHFVNQEFLLDGELDVNKPEALINELKNSQARLVGVEYIVLAAQWDGAHTAPPAPPVLEGQLFHFNESPNRFRLDPFYELHVWAWRENPNGTFVDWNPRVSCDGQ